MRYYGFLLLVLSSLIASVFVEGKNLFSSDFFTVAYSAMSIVLIIGSKYKEKFKIDMLLGTLLIFSIGFLSTQTLIEMATNTFTGLFIFKVAIIVSLDYAAIGFLREGLEVKKIEELKANDRYGTYES